MKRYALYAATMVAALACATTPAWAAFEFTANSAAGVPGTATVAFQDVDTGVMVSIFDANPQGDVRAFYLNGIPQGATILGDDVTRVRFSADSIRSGTSVSGLSGPFDLAVEFGTPRDDRDVVTSPSFTILGPLTLADIADSSGLLSFAVRVSSIGIDNESSKMLGSGLLSVPGSDPGSDNVGVIPEPGTLVVWSALGMVGAAGAWRRRRQRAAAG